MKLTSAGVFHAKLLRVLLVGQLYVLERRNMYRPQYAEKARKGSLDWDGISYFVGGHVKLCRVRSEFKWGNSGEGIHGSTRVIFGPVELPRLSLYSASTIDFDKMMP
jgi:hypothetical protein